MRTAALCSLGIVAALLATSAAPIHAGSQDPSPADPKGRWIEGRSPHFTFFSKLPPKETEQLARDMEEFRDVFGQVMVQARQSTPAPTRIFVFDVEGAFDPYRRSPLVLGYFLARTDIDIAAVLAKPHVTARTRQYEWLAAFQFHAVAFHEYTHFVLERTFPRIPWWLSEGLAEYFMTFRKENDAALIGLPSRNRLATFQRADWLPLQNLLQDRPRGEIDLLAAYAESWLLTHYILNGNPARRAQLDRYLDLVEQGVPSRSAFLQAFETTLDAFTEELQTYRKRNLFLMATVPLGKASQDFAFRSRPMSKAEVLARLGELAAHLGPEQLELGQAHLREAIRLEPGLASAHDGLGYALFRLERFEEATIELAKASAADPLDPLAHLHSGWNRLTQLGVRPGSDPDAARTLLERARTDFAKCLELAPLLAEAHFGAAVGALLANDMADAGLASMEHAWRELPFRMDVALTTIRFRAAAGRRAAAQAGARHVLRRYPGLMLDYLALPPTWAPHPQLAVPPVRAADVAPLFRELRGVVSEPSVLARLDAWLVRPDQPAPARKEPKTEAAAR